MHLVEILLPLSDNDGQPFGTAVFGPIRTELTERFGGLTAYSRAPAEGLWKEGEGAVARDDIVVFEVMAEDLDEAWWRDFRGRLERNLRQEMIVIRVREVRLIGDC